MLSKRIASAFNTFAPFASPTFLVSPFFSFCSQLQNERHLTYRLEHRRAVHPRKLAQFNSSMAHLTTKNKTKKKILELAGVYAHTHTHTHCAIVTHGFKPTKKKE